MHRGAPPSFLTTTAAYLHRLARVSSVCSHRVGTAKPPELPDPDDVREQMTRAIKHLRDMPVYYHSPEEDEPKTE